MNKTLNFKTFKTFLQLILLVVSVFGFSQTPVTYTANPTNAQINTAIIGNNINITGGTLNFGDRATQIATFTNGTGAALQMNNGVFFGTGTVAKLLTTNNTTQSIDDIPTTATFTDADLTAIDATATRDVVSYSFTVTLGPKATTLNIRYQFGSEEYPDFVGTNFDDAFGFFVTGPGISGTTNLAKLPNNNPTTINKVNFGTPGYNTAVGGPVAAYDGSQSALYINNGHNTNVSGGKLIKNTNPGPFPVAVQFNGITRLITYSLSGLTPGGTYTFKIAIADAGDPSMDSGVFINDIYATATLVANNDTYTIVSGSTSTTSVLNNDSVNGAAPASFTDVLLSQVSTTNAGVTLDPLTGKINVAAGTPAGTYTVTYQICDQTFTSNCKTATATITVQINDSDNDGIDNYYDLDDDNDGILDCDENLLGANASVSNVFSFVTAGTAVATSNNEVRLTQDTGHQAGQIWSVGKVDFTKSFVLRFDAYLGTRDNGADGIAAVFHNSPQGVNATGATGLGIGARGIANGIVLELDTYNNGTSLGDIPSDHGQIWDSDNQTSTGFLTTAIALPDLENSTWHPVVINWNATTKTISYTVDGTNAGTYTGDLVTNYFAGANKVYFGYTASTGGATNEQKIRINSFCSDLPLEMDNDNDGIPNQLDTDSDGDGCADAIEGSENVKYNQIHDLNLPLADPNYAYRGQIKVTYNGTTTSTPSGIISNSPSANGVPQLLNNAGNNLNASTNPSNLAGAVDNTDGTADIGQGIGDSQDNTINSCKCYKAPSTDSNTYPTQHGITAFNRAGADNQNWPMVRQSGWTALEASTKGFVINRMPVSTSGGNIGEPVDGSNNAVITSPIAGMMFYDTTNDCLKINVDGTRSGWKCFNNQSCPDEN